MTDLGMTEMVLTNAWKKQVTRLMDQKYPQAMKLGDSDFWIRMARLKDTLMGCLESGDGSFSIGLGNIPLLIVFPPNVINYPMQLRLNKFDTQFCHIKLPEVNNAESNAGHYAPYIILDVEISDKPQGSPRYLEGLLKIRQKRGLNFEEGIALLGVLNYDYPEIKPHNQIVLTGAQYGGFEDGLIACLDFAKSPATPIIDCVYSANSSTWNAIASCHQLTIG